MDVPAFPPNLTEEVPLNGVAATRLPPPPSPPKRAWWKEATVYQIYPASFHSTTSSGVGDIPGVTAKLDHIHSLGADLVWLCPIYKSPQVDMGYDISDYRQIDERYGTLDDVDTLIAELKKRDMRLVMDLVVNHTSDQHDWFLQSRSSRTSPYRDWYVWRDPKYDANGQRIPPNNWASYFGGSAWEYDDATEQYYLHIFATAQPDLNWENPAVEAAVHDLMRFWLDRGVAGFRMDVINFISKYPGLPDASVRVPGQQWQFGDEWYAAGPKLNERLKRLGDVLREYDGFSVGEMPCVNDPAEIVKAVGAERGELNMVINFEIVDMDHGPLGKYSPKQWQMSDLKRIVSKWQTFMHTNDGWNALYLENHDQSRSVSRFLNPATDELRGYAAKTLATFLACQAGTLFVYQGQEIGMGNMPEDWGIEEYKDVETVNHWAELLKTHPDDKALHQQTLAQYRLKARDNARTPVQWTSEPPNAGFFSSPNPSTKPWMRVNPDHTRGWNVASQTGDSRSVLAFWTRLLRLRKEERDLFVYGEFALVDPGAEDVVAFSRTAWTGDRALVVCNFRAREVDWRVPLEIAGGGGMGVFEEVLLASYPDGVVVGEGNVVRLRPFECFVSVVRRVAG